MARSFALALPAAFALGASPALAQEVQLTGPLSGSSSDPSTLSAHAKLFLASATTGTVGRLSTSNTGDEATSAFIPVGGVDVRWSFAWPWPGARDLRNAIGASFAAGEGAFVANGTRRARVVAIDSTYSASYPIAAREGAWKVDGGAAGGLSGVMIAPEGDEPNVYAAGLRMAAELSIQLDHPQLRFALTTGLRPTFTIDAAKSDLLLFDTGISAGWAFAL